MQNDAFEKLKALKAKGLASNGVVSVNQEVNHDVNKPSQHVNPHVSSHDLAKAKDNQIARSVALNCSAQVTEAYARVIQATDMVKGMKEAEIRGWLKSLKATELSENMKFLTGKESEEIPF